MIIESRRRPAYMSILRDLGYSEEELVKIEDYDDWDRDLAELERRLNKKAKEKTMELIEETDNDWIMKRKLEFVKEKVKYIKSLEIRIKKANYPYFFSKALWEIYEAKKWTKRESWLKKPIVSKNSINDRDIELARNMDIKELIEVDNKNFAFCPAHSDKNPSLYCKNNFVYCFSCGFKADTIGLYMKLNNVGFIEAVKFLNRRQ